MKLRVNFLPEIITLSKEVRNIKNLGFRVPLAIVNKAHQANQIYPFAISLIESVRTYERTLEKVQIIYLYFKTSPYPVKLKIFEIIYEFSFLFITQSDHTHYKSTILVFLIYKICPILYTSFKVNIH